MVDFNKKSSLNNHKLDKYDLKILSRLLDNCRESDRQIGGKVGISGTAVRSRIKKMIDNGIIQNFALKIEPPVLGYNVVYIVTTGQDIEEILKQVELIGEPFFVVPCVGGITVCSIVVKENVNKKIELAKNLMKEVRILSIFEAEYHDIRSDLTKTDLEIISILLKNPRKKIEEISKEASLSTKTVTRSLKKFQNDEAILFTAIYNPSKLDPYISFAILIWVEHNLNETLKDLRLEFGNSFLQKPFVAKNQLVLFLHSDNIFEIDNIIQRTRQIKNVVTADLFIPKKISLPQKWVMNIIKTAKSSQKLHLMYQRH